MQKLSYTRDEKVPDAGTFTLYNEDHPVGNMVRMQLHEDRTVVFSGYRIPHPLESRMLIMIRTNGQKSPIQAMDHALDDLRSEFGTIIGCMDEGFRKMGGGGGAPGGGLGGGDYMQY